MLKPGQKYHIVYKSDTMRIPRQAVLKFIRTGDSCTIWDFRPEGGTQHMPDKWVISVEPVDNSTKMYINRKVT